MLKENNDEVIGSYGDSVFIGALFLKDDKEGMYSDRAVSINLINLEGNYELFIDAGMVSDKLETENYREETLKEICFDYIKYL